jgi:hypothetical protein
MTQSEKDYDDCYQSAIWCITKLRGHGVDGKEKTSQGCVRYRSVDGLPATDETIFELAWGKDAAVHIRQVWKT